MQKSVTGQFCKSLFPPLGKKRKERTTETGGARQERWFTVIWWGSSRSRTLCECRSPEPLFTSLELNGTSHIQQLPASDPPGADSVVLTVSSVVVLSWPPLIPAHLTVTWPCPRDGMDSITIDTSTDLCLFVLCHLKIKTFSIFLSSDRQVDWFLHHLFTLHFSGFFSKVKYDQHADHRMFELFIPTASLQHPRRTTKFRMNTSPMFLDVFCDVHWHSVVSNVRYVVRAT